MPESSLDLNEPFIHHRRLLKLKRTTDRMTNPIHAQYLAAASQLERSYLLAYDEGFPASREQWNSIYQKFDELKTLYEQATRTLVDRELEEVKKAHDQVEFVFPLRTPYTSRTYDPDTKSLHYLRIALEHELHDLIPKYLSALSGALQESLKLGSE
jgi:hypothetical protein